MAYDKSDSETMCYIARAGCCGLICGITLDDGSERDRKSNAKDIAQWIRDGLNIERVTVAAAKADPLYFVRPCPGKPDCRGKKGT